MVLTLSSSFGTLYICIGSTSVYLYALAQNHCICFGQAADFGGLLKLMLHKLSRQLDDPPYNFMFHSAPFELPVDHLPFTHWFLQIVPQLSITGGFEMGSGCYINPVFPEDAAKILREVDCPK